MSNNKDVLDKVFGYVEENKIQFVYLWFSDVLGRLKSFSITPRELDEAFNEGMGFDGSSIHGFARIDESDLIAKPDPKTFSLLPWQLKEHPVAKMFCDILKPDGEPYEGDPRYALKRCLNRIEKNYIYNVGPELEFFYFKNDKNPETIDNGGYFDLTTLDAADDLQRDTILTLERMGIIVEYSHHEGAPSQHEIDLRYRDALTMADIVMTYRAVVKEMARQYGYYATFMPKPLVGVNGSSMHVHQSLFKNGKNVFFDSNDVYHLSNTAKWYIAGLLKYAPEITSILNQWVNSYKRLVPGFEAPVYVSWARRNQSTLIRVPIYKPGKEESTRIELRSPDPACNPYLAFAVMLAAGLAGIKERLELPLPIEEDVYCMNKSDLSDKGITVLPGSLIEAITLTEKSRLVHDVLGDHIFNKFIGSKKVEWDNYRTQVTEWELKKYLPIL